jgi:iron complex outermembrane receptor protein
MNLSLHATVGLMALAASLAQPAFAQTAGETSAQSEPGGLGEIVVTAQRRTERLQDVPVAVTALSAASLASRGVRSVSDLAMVTPGLVFPSVGIGGSPRIRGIGTQISNGGNENSVVTYVDGVYYPAAGANVMAFNNIEQVAILKGPQGTLFGRNATGGLIQITTHDPGQDVEANAHLGYGNLKTFTGNAYLSGGIADGVAADIAINYKNQKDGFGKNLFNGLDVGTSESFAARSKLKASLGDATTATLIADYSHIKGSFPGYRPVPGQVSLLGTTFAGDKFDVNSDIQPMTDSEDYGVSLNLTHDFSGVKLVSISAYRHGDWKFNFDSDSLPAPIVSANGIVPDRMFSQEIQLLSTTKGPLSWVVGLYYFNRKSGFVPAQLAAPALGFIQDFTSHQDTESFAGFGQATYKITEKTSVTAGLRLTTETKSFAGSGVFRSLAPVFNAPLGPVADSQKVTKLTWRAAIDHHINDDVMVYASYNRGFKSGGYDAPSVAVASYFRPEVLDAIEAGLKSEFLDRHLRINGAAYYYDFKDIQLNTYINGLPAVYNGKSAKNYGFDLDIAAVPVTGLTLTAGVGYVHGRFDDFQVAKTVEVPTGGIAQVGNISAKGKRLPNTPDWTVNLGIEYSVPIGETNLLLSGDYFHSSEWFAAPENRTRQSAYSLVNASATLSFANDRYSVKVWGRNLGNVAYASQLFNQVPVADVVYYAEGRTFGVTLGAKF